MYDFNEEFSQIYEEVCVCGKTIEVSTQKDNNPEYHTDIYVRCFCGYSVAFHLPVN